MREFLRKLYDGRIPLVGAPEALPESFSVVFTIQHTRNESLRLPCLLCGRTFEVPHKGGFFAVAVVHGTEAKAERPLCFSCGTMIGAAQDAYPDAARRLTDDCYFTVKARRFADYLWDNRQRETQEIWNLNAIVHGGPMFEDIGEELAKMFQDEESRPGPDGHEEEGKAE